MLAIVQLSKIIHSHIYRVTEYVNPTALKWPKLHQLHTEGSKLNVLLILSAVGIKYVTVNSEIFARVLFSRNFAYAKFPENKILTKWRNHSVNY